MKTVLCVGLLLVLPFAGVYAHTPGPVAVKVADEKVDIEVTHSVSNPQSHFVKLIAVRVNGEEAARKEFSAQENDAAQSVSFDIDGLKPGDELEVRAVCSRIGETVKKVTVE